MRFHWIAAFLVASISAAGRDAVENVSVDVRIGDTLTSPRLLESNKVLVSEIFKNIGVQIDWQTDNNRPDAGKPFFEIRVIPLAPTSATAEALASMRLAGSAITVYEDRVRQSLRRAHPAAAKVALAYVIAHELAHAMQGIARHSDRGIMKAQWSNDDFTAMLFHKLEFASSDVELIRTGLGLGLARADLGAK